MTIHIGLLRAVNLAGHNKIGMADLRDLLAAIGMQDARTLLQSGNVVFRSGAQTAAQLEAVLEKALAKRLGLETDFFVRDAADWKAMIAANPFPAEAKRDPGHLVVTFLKDAPSAESVKALQSAIKDREIVKAKGRHAYVVYPDGIGRSRLTTALMEKTPRHAWHRPQLEHRPETRRSCRSFMKAYLITTGYSLWSDYVGACLEGRRGRTTPGNRALLRAPDRCRRGDVRMGVAPAPALAALVTRSHSLESLPGECNHEFCFGFDSRKAIAMRVTLVAAIRRAARRVRRTDSIAAVNRMIEGAVKGVLARR